MKFIGIIPARYASTRFPAKPLALLGGKPVIQRVYEQVAGVLDEAYVATDDERIEAAVKAFGGKVVMTSVDHKSGTDRCYEAYCKVGSGYDVVVNIQGDEPLIAPDVIDDLCRAFEAEPDLTMATVAAPLQEDEYDDPSAVKVVLNQKDEAMYFSRSLIPYPRHSFEEGGIQPYKHIGIYAYRRDFLLQYAAMEQTPAEKVESLEQLRVLENGYKIKVIKTHHQFIGIDTPDDLEHIRRYFAESAHKGE